MNAGLSPARLARAQHRHDLGALTYVTVEQTNVGIIRNLNHRGMGAQVVAAVRPGQQVRVRFELRNPRLRVDTHGEVTWAAGSGQCGIRFFDLSPKVACQIDEWIFGNLLERASLQTEWESSIFAGSALARSASAVADAEAQQDDGLMVSASPVKVIEMPAASRWKLTRMGGEGIQESSALDWLSQPLSGRGLVWTVNTLVIVAALLLFALIFLFVTGEAPQWPLVTAVASAIFVAALYWGFFRLLGGASPGERLARMAGWDLEDDDVAKEARFR